MGGDKKSTGTVLVGDRGLKGKNSRFRKRKKKERSVQEHTRKSGLAQNTLKRRI